MAEDSDDVGVFIYAVWVIYLPSILRQFVYWTCLLSECTGVCDTSI